MLANAPVAPTIPVTDLARAREFYEKKLGFTVIKERSGGISFQAGNGTKFYMYKRGPSKADHTLASFMVDDVEKTVDELTKAGIVFEQYDFPGLKTNEKGIAVLEAEGEKGAWFKDPDGNILAVGEEI
jgi:catechol 2,3-dioxygenase-like lactoylglutathione lyase family enzyme